MATELTIIVDNSEKIVISRDIEGTYMELANLFYSASIALGYATDTVDKYIDCEYNDFALSNKINNENGE